MADRDLNPCSGGILQDWGQCPGATPSQAPLRAVGPLFSSSLVLCVSCSLCQVMWSLWTAVSRGSWEWEGHQHRPCSHQHVRSHRVGPWWADLGAGNCAYQHPLTHRTMYQVQSPAMGSRQEQKEMGPAAGLERSYSVHPRGPWRRQATHGTDTVRGATQHLRWTLAGLVSEIKRRFISQSLDK